MLSEAQRRALHAMPCAITMWGGKPFAGMPDGVRSQSTLRVLHSKGLIQVRYHGTTEHWSLTPAGRASLEKGE